ncbi:unnamed protein product [Mytilus coruscus]|uniref:MAM domain-containing protein n=1 Tax=Mytilus coruscus TaxID=42192 RepID=A0A6J8DPQ7_MYTCO|nr:unnamed protein product [Mytilus coruscus]
MFLNDGSYVEESKTSVSTFEDDFGDWVAGSSQNVTWKRTNLVKDHTHVDSSSNGYSMTAVSYSDFHGTARIVTDIEFTQPICLSLWYQLYWNSFDSYFNIYQISDKNQVLLFTANHNFTSLADWNNISVDCFGRYPFKIALEADFRYRDGAARLLVISRYISTDNQTKLISENRTSVSTFEDNFGDWLNVSSNRSTWDRTRILPDHTQMTPGMNNITEGSVETPDESSIQFDIIGIAAGVSGGVLLTIIAVVVICRFRGSNGCDCVTKHITSLVRKGQGSRIIETGVYECSNIPSRLSDHAYDSFECANYYNMTNVPNSSTSGHHGNDRDLYINQ